MPEKKFFDVSKPGKAMPQTGAARPAIVGHRTLLKDPMMVAAGGSSASANGDKTVVAAPDMAPASDTKPASTTTAPPIPNEPTAADTSGTHTVTVKTGVTKIQPLHDDIEPEQDGPDSSEKPASITDEKTDNLADIPHDSQAATPEAMPPAASSESPANSVQTVGSAESETQDDQAQAVAEAVAEQEQKVAQLVADKTYFVPIGEKHQAKASGAKMGSSAALIYFVLGIVLLLAAAYLAIDAELIDVPFELPVRLLSK